MPRAEWELELPARTEFALDDRNLPSGERAEAAAERAPLGERVLDDHFAVAEDARFALAGGGREIAVEWAGGYRFAQVFAPAGTRRRLPGADDGSDRRALDRRRARARAAGRARERDVPRARHARSRGPAAGYAMMCAWPRGPETTASDERAPVVRVDVLETFVELLTRVEDDGSSDAFYSSLCEAVCRLTSMDRAIIFRYDEARRRVRAAGAFGIALERFTNSHVTVESAPIARQALSRTA